MSTVGHPHLGPRRHWANQRARPCHSRAWVETHLLKEMTGAVVEQVSATAVPARTAARLVARLRRWARLV